MHVQNETNTNAKSFLKKKINVRKLFRGNVAEGQNSSTTYYFLDYINICIFPSFLFKQSVPVKWLKDTYQPNWNTFLLSKYAK